MVNNLVPYEEIFIGSNLKSYKHKYFIAIFNDDIDNINHPYQLSEISKVQWFNYEDAMKTIRNYNLEKKRVLEKVYKIINEYSIYP